METKRISGLMPGVVEETGKMKKTNKADESVAARETTKDKKDFDVQLSDRARDAANARAKAMEIARRTPDIREDRVAELKKKIQDGSYQPDAGKIADGMLKEAIRDKLAMMNDE